MRVVKYHIKKQDIDIQSDLFSGIYTILSHTIGPNLSLEEALGGSFCRPVPDEVFVWSFMVKDKMVGLFVPLCLLMRLPSSGFKRICYGQSLGLFQ